MGTLTREQERIGAFYDTESAFRFERDRLEKLCPVEFHITRRLLERHVPTGARAVDLGVGVGHYAEILARRGCVVHLVDVSNRLLEAARRRLIDAGFGALVGGVHRASATDLDMLGEASVDVVLMFGPLYHLRDAADRARAVAEARRVLRSGGLLFAAGINRLAYLRDLFRQRPGEVVNRRDFHRQFLADGNLDPEHAPPIGYAHLTTIEEFDALFAGAFDRVVLTGAESFTTVWQDRLAGLSRDVSEGWLDLIEQTGSTPEGLAQSDHLLFIGCRRQG